MIGGASIGRILKSALRLLQADTASVLIDSGSLQLNASSLV